MLPEKECLNERQAKYKLVTTNDRTYVGDNEIVNADIASDYGAGDIALGDLFVGTYECPPEENIGLDLDEPVFDIDFTGSISNRVTKYPLTDLVTESLITGVNREGIPIANFGEGSKLSFAASNGTVLTTRNWMVCLIGTYTGTVGSGTSEATIFQLNNVMLKNVGLNKAVLGKIGIGMLTFNGTSTLGRYHIDDSDSSFTWDGSIGVLPITTQMNNLPFALMIGRGNVNGTNKYMCRIAYDNGDVMAETEFTLKDTHLLSLINPNKIQLSGNSGKYSKMTVTRCIGYPFYDINTFNRLISLQTTYNEIIKNYQ